jgi:hypothetical protein
MAAAYETQVGVVVGAWVSHTFAHASLSAATIFSM